MIGPRFCLQMALTLLVASLASDLRAEVAATISSEQEKFFEEQVRPVLVEQCFKCHGEKKQESGLRLDSRASILRGGDSGEAAAIPGDAEKSLLVKSINHVGDYQMPPEAKLPAKQIEAISAWVKDGLPWPNSMATLAPVVLTAAERAKAAQQSQWSLQTIERPAPATVKDANWSAGTIDTFVLARLEAAGLAPSPEADRRTLIRRLSYDLLGLPPTMEDVQAFIADESPDAYERLVDRLLASPHYGERWGRHWLDVARYADTKGYAFQKERRYPYAYTYRDYVIDAFNRDLPYNDFIRQQLAADRLPLGEDKSALAAMGFLTTGRRFNNGNDDIDDQIDVVTRGLLGLTVACARCHDHKYDAIPTEDYYSLYGVFASSTEPDDLPLVGEPQEGKAFEQFSAELKKRRDEAAKFSAATHAEMLDTARKRSADYLARLLINSQETKLFQALAFLALDPGDIKPRLVERWRVAFRKLAKPDHAALGLWSELEAVPESAFAERSPTIVQKWLTLPAGTATGQANPLLQAALASEPPIARAELARLYGKLFSDAYAAWQAAGANDEALAKLPEDQRQLAEVLLGKESPTDIPASESGNYLSRADRNKLRDLEKKVESLEASSPAAPPRGMVVYDKPQPVEPRVLIRGNQSRPGNKVPRQFLLVLSPETREPFHNGSGRLELAEAIVDPANPLTRRVIANRLWMHHFGEPLVPTASDFGIRSDEPTHPQVLDDLAARMLETDWSLKTMQKQIVTSSTYRQASGDRPEARQVDPENRLLWRMNRRRLELEAMRDTLLAVAGRLDPSLHGRAVELTSSPFSTRRAIYGYIDRQDLPNFFRVFDIASPDQSSPRRPRTTVPQQALFFMNSPFVVEQAQALAARPEVANTSDWSEQIKALYHLLFAREPDSDELSLGLGFLASAPTDAEDTQLSPLVQYAQLLLLTNELMYVD